MTDSNSPNHWEGLASLLGASPAPEEPTSQAKPAAAQEPSPTKAKESRHARPAAPQRAADWDVLASELGLQPSRPSTPPAPRSVAKPAAVVPPPLPEEPRRAVTPPELPEESPNFFDERFDFEEPFDLLESSEAPAEPVEPTEESAEATERRPRKRRRRRRRGRGGESRESAAAPAGDREPDVEPEPLATGDVEEATSEPVESGDKQERTEETEGGESREGRPRRRRWRRGRGRRDRETAPKVDDESKESSAPSSAPQSREEEPIEADLFADDGVDLGEGEHADADQPARLGFRGIPAWNEVIGLLIEKNIEAHAKRPSGGPHHGRGGRGPRDNRGSRGGDKRRS